MRRVRVRSQSQSYGVVLHRARNRNIARCVTHRQDLVTAKYGLSNRLLALRRTVHDLVHMLGFRVHDPQLVEEAVHLCLGQRVGAFQFYWVLRRKNEEWWIQLMGRGSNGDRLLLHRLK